MTVTSKRHALAESKERKEKAVQQAASIGGAVRDPVPEDVLRREYTGEGVGIWHVAVYYGISI